MGIFMRRGLLLISLAAVALLGGCYNSKSSSSIMVTLSPSSPQIVSAGQTIGITASVSGTSGYSSNNAVTWSLSGVGSLINRTPTSATYDAPASASASGSATVTATSVADSSKNASLKISVAAIQGECGAGNESQLKGHTRTFCRAPA